MMIYKTGDILESVETIICHQVNEDGYMGGGLALQIATNYPHVEESYKEYCEENKNNLTGNYQIVSIENHRYIANCFSQNNFVTDYDALKQIFRGLLESCKTNDFTICVPYKYGCGIAKGNWEEVENIFKKLSNEYGVDIVIYQRECDKSV